MKVFKLGSYAVVRGMCSGKRYATKGRLIDNYTAVRLEQRDTPHEHIIIAQKRWNPDRGYESKLSTAEKEKLPKWVLGDPVAKYYPNHEVELTRINYFSTHQRETLFRVYAGRDKHKYKTLTDGYGKKVLFEDGVVLKMDDAGIRGKIIKGTPVPSLAKDDAASLQWRREWLAFRKAFAAVIKVGAHSELYMDEDLRADAWKNTKDFLEPEAFVEVVRSHNYELMVKFAMRYIGRWVAGDQQAIQKLVLSSIQNHYNRSRRDILVAAGARFDTN